MKSNHMMSEINRVQSDTEITLTLKQYAGQSQSLSPDGPRSTVPAKAVRMQDDVYIEQNDFHSHDGFQAHSASSEGKGGGSVSQILYT